jgi:hypothetical protein
VDPVTIALIGSALLAAVGIKRAAAPPRSGELPDEAAPEAQLQFSDLYARMFRGNLPAPVTSATPKARGLQAAADARGDKGRLPGELGVEPASPGGLPAGLGRAAGAAASGIPADFAGAPTAPGGAVSASRRGPQMFQWVTPLQGRYVGQSFLVPAGSYPKTTSTIKVLSGPVAG